MSDKEDLKARFTKFRQDHAQEILEVHGFLAEPMPDDPVQAFHGARTALAYRSRIGNLLGWAVSYLKSARMAYLPEEGTVLEREVRLESDTADFRRFREMLDRHYENLGEYINLAKKLMDQARDRQHIGA